MESELTLLACCTYLLTRTAGQEFISESKPAEDSMTWLPQEVQHVGLWVPHACRERQGALIRFYGLAAGTNVVYTYDVYWELTEISWASRWDAYLRMPGGRVHWFSILNSLMVVVVMSSIVAMIMLRTIRRDLARYEGILGESGGSPNLQLPVPSQGCITVKLRRQRIMALC